jgi:hypothetical protein
VWWAVGTGFLTRRMLTDSLVIVNWYFLHSVCSNWRRVRIGWDWLVGKGLRFVIGGKKKAPAGSRRYQGWDGLSELRLPVREDRIGN